MKRRTPFAVGEYYHIFNRGTEKIIIFREAPDYRRFTELLRIYNTEKPAWLIRNILEIEGNATPRPEERLVDISAYCLNPNHFHLLLRENINNGITTFMKKICTGYAMYFNKKYARSGVLFQGRFKSVHIDSNDQLLHVSVYVNCNSQIHNIQSAQHYPWCSFSEYVNGIKDICLKGQILDQFDNPRDFEVFCQEKALGMRERKDLINLLEDRP